MTPRGDTVRGDRRRKILSWRKEEENCNAAELNFFLAWHLLWQCDIHIRVTGDTWLSRDSILDCWAEWHTCNWGQKASSLLHLLPMPRNLLGMQQRFQGYQLDFPTSPLPQNNFSSSREFTCFILIDTFNKLRRPKEVCGSCSFRMFIQNIKNTIGLEFELCLSHETVIFQH